METRSIKYFLHLYLGCECLFIASGSEERRTEQGVLVEMPFKGTEWGIIHSEFLPHEVKIYAFVHDIKPILRPLSDMTDDERYRLSLYDVHIAGVTYNDILKSDSEKVIWLLSKHFDLFGLIESGLAIDKKTLTNK